MRSRRSPATRPTAGTGTRVRRQEVAPGCRYHHEMHPFPPLTANRLTPLALVMLAAGIVAVGNVALAIGDRGEPPVSAWSCARDHPVKGNFTTYNGEPCIYHVPGGSFYEKTKPERCYATESEARADGCRRSSR